MSLRAVPLLFLTASVIAWGSTHPPLPTPGEPVLFATQCRDDLELLYSRAIEEAQESIEFQIFALTRPRIIEALNRAAERGVQIELRYDGKENRSLPKRLHPAITQHPIQLKGLMHRKTLLIDGKRHLIGSANMTRESLRMHGNLVAHFGEGVRIWNLPEDEGAYERLIEAVDGATERLCVAMFTWTHPVLAERVIAAHNRGVKVEVVIDGGTARGASKPIVERLRAAGVETRLSLGPELLHHKFVWIDEELLLTGSVNWTRSAFSRNEETLIELRPNQRLKMRQLWRVIRCESSNPSDGSS